MTTSVERPRTSWIPDDRTFGARLALVRQRMSWGNVKEAAEACGVAVESWRRWERDGRLPHNIQAQVEKISDRTGCDFDWLLRGPRRQLRDPDVSVPGQAATAPYAEPDGVTVLFPQVAEWATRKRVAPPDHRPNGHPGGSVAPGGRRTDRVPRPGTGKRA